MTSERWPYLRARCKKGKKSMNEEETRRGRTMSWSLNIPIPPKGVLSAVSLIQPVEQPPDSRLTLDKLQSKMPVTDCNQP